MQEKAFIIDTKLADVSSIGLALCQMDGVLVYVNPAYANIVGYLPEEVLCLSCWDLTPKKYESQEGEQLQQLSDTGCYGYISIV